MRRTKEEAELTCQSTLDVATKEFSRNGYAATRLEDIAKTAAVT
jgi:AcrR family transcriptional regulator